MDELDQIFKQSSEQDRNFPVPDSRWSDLERDLDQKRRRPFSGFRWIHLLVFFVLMGTSGMRQSDPQNFDIEPSKHQASPKEILKPTPKDIPVAKKIIADKQSEIYKKNTTLNRALIQRDPVVPSSNIVAAAAEEHIPNTIRKETEQRIETFETDQLRAISESSSIQNSVNSITALQQTMLPQKEDMGVSNPTTKKEAFKDVVTPLPSKIMNGEQKAAVRFSNKAKNLGGSKYMYQPNLGSGFNLRIPASDAPKPYEGDPQKGTWQVSLNVGGLFGSNARLLSYYSTEPGNPAGTQIYTFPSGDTTRLYFLGSVVERQTSLGLQAFQLDLHRVTASGFGAKLGIAYAYTKDDNNDMGELVPQYSNVFYFTRSNRQSFFAGEFGIDYTFNRDRRLQYRVGITAFTVFTGQSKTKSYAFQPDQNYQNLEFSTQSKTLESAVFGYYFESGMQWVLNDKFSLGPRFNFAGLPFATKIILGGGIEARYRF